MKALALLWNNRTLVMGALQIICSQMATSGLLADASVKWLMLGSGILTALIALFNGAKLRKEASDEPTA